MTRVLFYNILLGGTHRTENITSIIRSVKPDVVGLVEATDVHVIKELAKRLDMQYCLSRRDVKERGGQGVVLSRLPIIEVKRHSNAILTKQPLLEVCVEEHDSQHLTVFVTHLTADFSKGWLAAWKRRREIQEILRILAFHRGTKHILMGDFNSLAPKERLQGSSFLRYAAEPALYYQLQPDPSQPAPDLNFALPPGLRFAKPLLELVPRSEPLSALLDSMNAFYKPRGGIDLLLRMGYVDCFRHLHPGETGFTWPAPLPSGRVDFIFASPELAKVLHTSDVITEGEGVPAWKASDHLPVFATFSEESE